MSQNTNIKCLNCGLVNWSNQEKCKRCNTALQDLCASFSSSNDDLNKVTVSQHILFVLLYIIGVALAGITTGLIFYAGSIFEIISVTYAIAAVTLGFVVPLAGVHYFIENRKTRITGKSYVVTGAAKEFAHLEQELINDIPVWLRFIQGAFVIFSAVIAAAVSGQILNNFLPSGDYPNLLIGLPALIVGFAVLFVTSILIKVFIKKESERADILAQEET